MERTQEQDGLRKRHACWLLGTWRKTQRYESIQKLDEEKFKIRDFSHRNNLSGLL